MRRLQCAAAVITVFGVAHWLTATWLFATSEPSISGDHPGMMSEDKLEHKLKLISQSTAKMEVQMSKLLLEVERLQASGTKSGSVHGRHRRRGKALADKAGDKAHEQCPDRRPYHTVLTATGSNYQQWQARIMYYHWKKQAAAGGSCTDMAAFTRLCATPNGQPDGLQDEIPTLFTVELTPQVLASHFGFGVLNRPNSVKQLMESATLLKEIRRTSEYVLILETDHVIMRPIPNLATPTTPAAFVFGYMYPQRSQEWVIRKYWPEGTYDKVQPVGPSPVLIHLDQLQRLYQKWLDFSLDLR